MEKINLKALTEKEIFELIRELELPHFRAKQMLHWIYQKYAQSISEITEFSFDLRERLDRIAFISKLTILDRRVSSDGSEKFLFELSDGEAIESVVIPDDERLTLCISSQAGCPMGCIFCATGRLGLKRNLKSYEIVDQLISASRAIVPKKLTNYVFMGMGEPLLNLDNTVDALWKMVKLMKISPRRITISTSGIAPKIQELGEKAPPVNLAISLNASNDRTRDLIMPVNKSYPLKKLIEACRRFPVPPRKRITFEYIMLKGINDSPNDAARLLSLLKGIPSKVNLIPFNPFKGCDLESSDDKTIFRFQEILLKGNMTAMIRKSKGADIGAACGQLGGFY
jgi:23S rRNA (adenine2503-C2)-methyltransferase